ESRLAGVRVTDDGSEEQPLARARAARSLALPRDLVKRLAQILDALSDDLTIALELRFTGAARADAAAETRHLFASSGQPRQPVLELRELHLDPALARARVPREDVEDHGRTVDDRRARDLLESPLL